MSTISVSNDFSTFCSNLRMQTSTVETVRARYQNITRRINLDYWSSDSSTSHSIYVGSYGRGTAIYTSDIDVVVELPWTEYIKYNAYSTGGQSALLQAVKNILQKTYSSSEISADGQVVAIHFSDYIDFEIVPAFRYEDGSYCYGDTNNGGSWEAMDPRSEIDTLNYFNTLKNKNAKRLCRMARAWNTTMGVCMQGYLIDSTVYSFLKDYKYSCETFIYYDWISRDYFKYLYDNAEKEYWVMPGSGIHVVKKYSFKAEAKKAYDLSLEAIKAGESDYSYTWHNKWREIYGNKFPIS